MVNIVTFAVTNFWFRAVVAGSLSALVAWIVMPGALPITTAALTSPLVAAICHYCRSDTSLYIAGFGLILLLILLDSWQAHLALALVIGGGVSGLLLLLRNRVAGQYHVEVDHA